MPCQVFSKKWVGRCAHWVKAMRPKRKRGLAIAGGVVALIIIAGIVAALLFNINSYKSRIETAASEATGLDVRINGRMGLSFFPFGVSARNIHVTSEGGDILSLESLKIGVKLMPLLKRQLEVTSCELVKPCRHHREKTPRGSTISKAARRN